MRPFLIALLLASAPLAAADYEYTALLDTDGDAASGCIDAPSGLSADWRLSARSNRQSVLETRLESCRDGAWIAVDAPSVAPAVRPRAGHDGSDRIEWTQPWSAQTPGAEVRFRSRRIDVSAQDRIDGAPLALTFGLPDYAAAVPTLGLPALLLLGVALAWAVRRPHGMRLGAIGSVLLVALASVEGARVAIAVEEPAATAADAANDCLEAGADLVGAGIAQVAGGLRLHFDVNDIEDAGLRDGASVLFIGNSLTYSNNLPEILEAIAAQVGLELSTTQIARPNAALEDHYRWRTAHAELARGVHALVVMQQGPSSLPENQAHLEDWALRFDPLIRAGGARPALYMVWPDRSRLAYFDDVRHAYSNAALAVDGMFIPAGEAWRYAWAIAPDLPLYDSDQFHPSTLGSYTAALSMFSAFYGRTPVGLPARLELPGGGVLRLDPEDALAAQQGAWAAHLQYARP